ncbi:3-isopropylmalate/(R)-2-methylmalate dehydratase small subunit [Rhodoligotrophos appendicifer]|uniref:3-isopropylmalate dehydratase small subunit n=1 Tax=Rhodoligotrophos appendicifer TaxID=987056 RepID=UPI0011857197|nr:3-isopropylmalate dehydratase small subunit [Rhodoligotrophos appendicifer]
MNDMTKTKITGRAISVRGNDIDTDRIIPARFMKHLTFEHLGFHVFEDDRAQLRAKGEVHPFEDPRFKTARILFVDRNFGCGSSREHAPQALNRAGVQAVVGESFGEIFAGNCISVGMPCVTVSAETMSALREVGEGDPHREYTLDLEERVIRSGNRSFPVTIGEGPRKQFSDGSWDPMSMLLSAKAEIATKAKALPYLAW